MKNIFLRRLGQLKSVLFGFLFKWKYDIIGFSRLPNVIIRRTKSPQFIVSLTSYGRRVNDVVPYTLISLLKQSMLPDRIILWLDEKKWNDITLPKKIRQLQEYGVEVRYCEDIRSYTKLIPALKAFPDDVIITVDDDIIYRRDLLEGLFNAYFTDPEKIHSQHARFPSLDHNRQLTPYTNWYARTESAYWIMPLGMSGVIYPPHSLHSDVTNYRLCKELCPMADDIWFWIMAIRQGTLHSEIDPHRKLGCSFDDLFQFLHKGSNLTCTNRKQGYNDVQLANVCKYFKFDFSILTPPYKR